MSENPQCAFKSILARNNLYLLGVCVGLIFVNNSLDYIESVNAIWKVEFKINHCNYYIVGTRRELNRWKF